MKRSAIFFMFFAFLYNLYGQGSEENTEVRLNVNLDLLSSHLWRGFKNGNSYSIQPTISADYKGLTIGTWVAFAGNNSYFEVDIFAEYTFRSITLSIYDYYCPPSTQMYSFTEIRKHYTKHTVDVMAAWKPVSLPFKVLLSTMVLGDDLSKTTNNQSYSTYIEPAFTWKWRKFSGELFCGLTPFVGYYASNPSFVNIGSSICYNLKIRRFELPLHSKLSYNPALKTTWYMFGLSLSFGD